LRHVAKEIQAFVALACDNFTFLIEPMTSTQIRQSFLDFFKSKQHTIVSSSSLMPDAV
jgi:hypothetical protein